MRDSDGDGIQNASDKCPLIPEDKDGHEDDDGCPDDDNDGDRRPDDEDKCADEAEDLDGFDDDDGCPELDNDGDKIDDLKDKCPNDAEDGKEPYPNDGCPANKRDTDGDGIPDNGRQCPIEEEDMDGFEDGDGCPEADNDSGRRRRRRPTSARCAPRTRTASRTTTAAPTSTTTRTASPTRRTRARRRPRRSTASRTTTAAPTPAASSSSSSTAIASMIDEVPTLAGKGLTKAGTQIVEQMAAVMLAHNEVTKWLVALAQPQTREGDALADAIKERLSRRACVADRIQMLGAAGPAKIGGVVQERGEPRRSCARPSVRCASAPRPPRARPWRWRRRPRGRPAARGRFHAQGQRRRRRAGRRRQVPDQPETKNGFQDDDGCPDEIPAKLKKFTGVIQGINFKVGSADLLAGVEQDARQGGRGAQRVPGPQARDPGPHRRPAAQGRAASSPTTRRSRRRAPRR